MHQNHPTAAPRRRRSILCLLVLAGSAFAQGSDGPYWSEYPIPAGGITFSRSLGTITVLQTPTEVHLFSGLTRTWTVQPISPAATLNITNAYCIIRDGDTFHGYSTRTGQVATLTTAAGAQLDIGSPTSSWVASVQDGGTVYAFSGFHGEWVPQPLQGALVAVQLGSHTLLAIDSQNAYGFSAFYGSWVPEPVRPGGFFQTFRSGAIGTWSAPDEVEAFSAYQNTWQTSAFPGAAATRIESEGYALLQIGTGEDALLFSFLTGNLVRHTAGPGAFWLTGPDVAIVNTPTSTAGYAPGNDAIVPLPTVGPAGNVLLATGFFGSYAILDDGSSFTAFQGLSGVATPAPGYDPAWSFTLGQTAAFAADPAGGGLAYSALRNSWTPAPTTDPVFVNPMFEGLVLTTANDYLGFSARRGTWSALPIQGFLVTQTSGTLTAAVDATGIDVYDPLLARWNRVDTGASTAFNVFRLTGVGHDGTTGYGYSLFTNTWDTIPLQGTVVGTGANSSIGFVETSSHYYVYTANGSLTNLSRFPEFSRFVTRGGRLETIQVAPPGSLVIAGFGTPDVELPLLSYGTLRLDPATLVAQIGGFVPASGILRIQYTVPNSPAFAGVELGLQDFVVPPSGAAWLTNAQAPFLW